MTSVGTRMRSKKFIQINREYIITSAELKKILQLKGEIESIGLMRGRSPKDIEEGKSAEKDQWYLHTVEVKPD